MQPVRHASGVAQRALLPALCYFIIVFSAGFLLGPIRVFWLEPRIGITLATACEMPLLTGVMFAAARWLPAQLAMDTAVPPLLFMGVGALALALLADFAVGAFLRGVSPTAQLAYLTTPAGLIYVASLAVLRPCRCWPTTGAKRSEGNMRIFRVFPDKPYSRTVVF